MKKLKKIIRNKNRETSPNKDLGGGIEGSARCYRCGQLSSVLLNRPHPDSSALNACLQCARHTFSLSPVNTPQGTVMPHFFYHEGRLHWDNLPWLRRQVVQWSSNYDGANGNLIWKLWCQSMEIRDKLENPPKPLS